MCHVYTLYRNSTVYRHSCKCINGKIVEKKIVFENVGLANTTINMIRTFEENNKLVPHMKIFPHGNMKWHCGAFHRNNMSASDITEFSIVKEDATSINETVVILYLGIDSYDNYTFFGVHV